MAVCLLESGSEDSNDGETKMKKQLKEEAAKLMVRVPGLRQKIAGKSIPLEVQYTLFLFSIPQPFFFFMLFFFPSRNSSHVKLVNSNHKINI